MCAIEANSIDSQAILRVHNSQCYFSRMENELMAVDGIGKWCLRHMHRWLPKKSKVKVWAYGTRFPRLKKSFIRFSIVFLHSIATCQCTHGLDVEEYHSRNRWSMANQFLFPARQSHIYHSQLSFECMEFLLYEGVWQKVINSELCTFETSWTIVWPRIWPRPMSHINPTKNSECHFSFNAVANDAASYEIFLNSFCTLHSPFLLTLPSERECE